LAPDRALYLTLLFSSLLKPEFFAHGEKIEGASRSFSAAFESKLEILLTYLK
jgi:hypothetical protein